MKITVDGKDCFELSETQKKVIKNDISDDIFEDDMKRRLEYILKHKYEQCFKRLHEEWCSAKDGNRCKLAANGVDSIPTDPDKLAELIFAQPTYKSRKTRDIESV